MFKIKILILLITSCLLLLTCSLHAQETVVDLGEIPPINTIGATYHKDITNRLNKYVGTWVYNDGVNDFKIQFTKKEHIKLLENVDIYSDVLDAQFLFKINGVVIYNTYTTLTSINTTNNHLSGVSSIIDNNIIRLIYSEPSSDGSCFRYKSGRLIISHDPTNNNLTWTRSNSLQSLFPDNECPDGQPMDNTDFLIPANMVLTSE